MTLHIPSLSFCNYINSASTTTVVTNSLIVGYKTTPSRRRGAIKFDLSGIPSSRVLVSSSFAIPVPAGGGVQATNASTISLYRVKRAMTAAGVCYAYYVGTTAWQTAGGTGANDIDTTALATGSVPATPADGSTITLNFSAYGLEELSKMCSGGAYTDYGFLLKTGEAGQDVVSYNATPVLEIDDGYKGLQQTMVY